VSTSIVVQYPFERFELAKRVDQLRGHTFDTPALYKSGCQAIAQCVAFRGQIEARRKELKADSLEYGRNVDAVAKDLTSIIENVESTLRAHKLEVDNAKAAAKRAAEEAKRAAVEAEIRAKREAEENELAVKRLADEERIRQERAALEAERAALAEDQCRQAAVIAAEREAARLEREKARAELAELRAEREKREAQKAEAEAEKSALELAERMKAEEEERRLNAMEYEAQKAKRIAALKPDKDKLVQLSRKVADLVELFRDEGFTSAEAQSECDAATEVLVELAERLTGWAPR
jgi:chromosome segregation ATPase